jgi:hypothetical protein
MSTKISDLAAEYKAVIKCDERGTAVRFACTAKGRAELLPKIKEAGLVVTSMDSGSVQAMIPFDALISSASSLEDKVSVLINMMSVIMGQPPAKSKVSVSIQAPVSTEDVPEHVAANYQALVDKMIADNPEKAAEVQSMVTERTVKLQEKV